LGSISRLFHWGLGFLIIGMLAYGWWMNHMAARPDRFFHRSIHADIGYVVLLLMVIRLVWPASIRRLRCRPITPRWRRTAARISHGALYGVTILVAMLGWAHSGAHKPDYADWFGCFVSRNLPPTDKASANFYENLHIYLAYLLIALLVIHIVAALYHVVRKDNVLARMIRGEPG